MRPLATCCHFINAALTDDGGARNFMAADGSWLDEPHHGDHVGRALWALGVLSANTDERLSSWSTSLLDRTVTEQSQQSESNLHTKVYALLGMAAARELDSVRTTGNRYLDEICAHAPGTPHWPWPEPTVRYDAGRIPQALIAAGRRFEHQPAIDRGRQLLGWLTVQVTRPERPHRFPGCLGLAPGVAINDTGDEQPLEAAAFAAAHATASELDESPNHRHQILGALAWFYGANRLTIPLVDDRSGACHDGLGQFTRNDNCGAESTIAYVETWIHAKDHLPRSSRSALMPGPAR